METLVIQQGDSARIEIVLPLDKMDQVQDVVCTVGNRLSYSISKGTLIPTATSNIFHLDIQSVQSQKYTGNLEVVVAIDYSDIGVKKTKRAENLIVQVVRNENYFNNNSISELVSAVVIVTVEEEVVTSIPILASYLVINGGGGGATNLGYTASPTNGVVTSDTGTDATIPLAGNTNAGLLSPAEKTAITHANRTTLDLITEAFTTSLKNSYDSAVTSLSSLLTSGVRLITSTEITKLSNTTGTNSGDETTGTIQTKRPLKTIKGQSLEGIGNVDLNKSDVGLGNVDNTSDLLKPISTATQMALNAKQNTLTAGTNISIVGDTISASGGGGTSTTIDTIADLYSKDLFFHEDFLNDPDTGNTTNTILTLRNAISGRDGGADSMGCAYFNQSTLWANGVTSSIIQSTSYVFGLGDLTFKSRFKLNQLSTSAFNNFDWYMGFLYRPSFFSYFDNLYFSYNAFGGASPSLNWKIVARNNSGTTIVDTGVPVVANQFLTLKIIVKANLSVEFYINEILVHTRASSAGIYPTGLPIVQMVRDIGEGQAERSAFVDDFQVKYKLTNPRL